MIYILIGILTISVAIYAMVSISASGMTKGKKITWFAIAALIPILGPLSYYLIKPNS